MNPNQSFEVIYPNWLLVPESLRAAAEMSLDGVDPHSRMIALYVAAETYFNFQDGVEVGDQEGGIRMADAVDPFNGQVWSAPMKAKAAFCPDGEPLGDWFATRVAVWLRDHEMIKPDCLSIFVLRRRMNDLLNRNPADGIAKRLERPDDLDRMIGRQQSRTTLADEVTIGITLHFEDAAGNRGAEVIRLRRFPIVPGPDRDFGDYLADNVEWLNPRRDHEAGALTIDPKIAKTIMDEIDGNVRALAADWIRMVDETLIDLRDPLPLVAASLQPLGAPVGWSRGSKPTGEHLADGLVTCGQPTCPTLLAASMVRAVATGYDLVIPVVSLSEPTLNYVTRAPDAFDMEDREPISEVLPHQFMDNGRFFLANGAGPDAKPSESQIRAVEQLFDGEIEAEVTRSIENLLTRVGTFGNFHQNTDRLVIDGLIDVRLAASLAFGFENLA